MDEARSINIDFFETYIHLDDLCRERLGFGISDYVNEMSTTPFYEQMLISGWERTYKKLRHMRHLRNELAHSQNAFDGELCTKGDTSYLKSICYKLENQNDPLTLLYMIKAEGASTPPDPDTRYVKINVKRVAVGAAISALIACAAIIAFHERKRK